MKGQQGTTRRHKHQSVGKKGQRGTTQRHKHQLVGKS